MESGQGDVPRSEPLDPKVVTYFENVVPNRVFVQNGDMFLGKYLVQLFKAIAVLARSRPPSPVEAPSLSQHSLDASSYQGEEEEATEQVYVVPDEVFAGLVKPENVRPDDNTAFWEYQMFGEFRMDLLSNKDYEHALSLKSNKERKKFLYTLFRELKRKEELKAENEEKADEIEQETEAEGEGGDVTEEKPFEIYTSLKHPEDLARKDPRKSYLDNVTIVQLCDSHLIQTCGIIIFDTFTSNNQSDLSLIQSTVASMLPNYKIDPALTPHSQNIVVISNLLPWQLTKPLLYADESDEIPMAFNERRLKKRKSHPDYENLLDLETFCLDSRRELKKNKNFQLHIVGSGIPYGLEEDIFYHWFALGYTNSDLTSLPVVNQGTNLVPTIHINELVKIIGHLVNNPRSVKKAYCIAVDNDSNTLADIVKAVSRLFTKHGAIYHVPLEEFEQTYPKDLVYSLDQKKTALDLLTSHLPVESNFVEDFGKEINLVQKNFVNNMRNTLKAFLKSHNLKPIKILIHGPPMSGKTELTRKLADHYGLQYLSPLDVLDNRKRYLRKQIKYCDHQIELLNLMNMSENENFDFDVMEEIDRNESNKPEDDSLKSEGDMNVETLSRKLMAYMEELRTLEELASKDRDQYESILRDMYLEVLRRKSVQYHGYVMDGWPDSYEACQLLFAKDKKEGEEEEEEENEESEEEEEDKEEEEGVNRALELVNKNLLPDLVISLEASQDWALSRFIAFMSDHPELFSPKQSLHEMDDRLGLLAPSSTHLFFLSDDMSENENEEVGENRWIRHFVKDYQLFRQNDAYPAGFSQFFNEIDIFPTVFNVEEEPIENIFQNILAREDYRRQLDKEREQEAFDFEKFQACLEELADKKKKEYSHLMEQWAGMNNILHYERNIIQELHNMPLRHYLMKYVLPVVTRGLNDVTQANPESPVDYLAEYLFKENPTLKLSNVHYNEKAEQFFNLLCLMKDKLKEL
ncbi:hypothetical protein M8J75_001730 [Diaphorina citri]|nr:hypothetical protein M8J75_001730 [Diaphorina citri]